MCVCVYLHVCVPACMFACVFQPTYVLARSCVRMFSCMRVRAWAGEGEGGRRGRAGREAK